jgi:hypothetical protein
MRGIAGDARLNLKKGVDTLSEKRYDLQDDEQDTPVVVCTPRCMIWGDLVTKKAVRVTNFLNVLAEDFVPIWDAKLLYLNGERTTEPLRRLVAYVKLQEILVFFSTQELEALPEETDLRRYEPVSLVVGDFQIDAEMLKSPMSEMSALLIVTKDPFMPFYRASVSCLSQPWLGTFQTSIVRVQRQRMLLTLTEVIPTKPFDL